MRLFRITIAAGVLAAAASVASAQTILKAEVPFPFRAGPRMLEAGTYQVVRLDRPGQPIFRISDEQGRQTILAMPQSATDARKSWIAAQNPVLSFQCTDSRCELTELWTGSGNPAYILYRPKRDGAEPTRTVAVVMRPVHTE